MIDHVGAWNERCSSGGAGQFGSPSGRPRNEVQAAAAPAARNWRRSMANPLSAGGLLRTAAGNVVPARLILPAACRPGNHGSDSHRAVPSAIINRGTLSRRASSHPRPFMLHVRRFCLFVALVTSMAALLHAQDWQPATVPDAWKNVPEGENLFVWYRCRVHVPGQWKGKEIKLFAEAADDAREFFIGGTKAGQFGEFPPKYRSGLGETTRFAVPADAVQFGKENVFAIRVCINQSRTGFNVAAPVLFAGDQAIRLAGKWESRSGDDSAWAGSDAAAISTEAIAKVEPAADVEAALKKIAGDAGPLPPTAALATMKTPDDLRVELHL